MIEQIGIALGAVVPAITIWKKAVVPKLKKRKQREKDKWERIDRIHEHVQAINKELTFNGGSSLKDAIYRIDASLAELTEQQKIAMNLQGVAYWISDAKGEMTVASPALCRILGRSEGELLGRKWFGWLVSEDRERIVDAWFFSVENSSPFDEVYSFKMDDDTVIKVWGLAFHKVVHGKHLGTLGRIEISE